MMLLLVYWIKYIILELISPAVFYFKIWSLEHFRLHVRLAYFIYFFVSETTLQISGALYLLSFIIFVILPYMFLICQHPWILISVSSTPWALHIIPGFCSLHRHPVCASSFSFLKYHSAELFVVQCFKIIILYVAQFSSWVPWENMFGTS